MKIIAGIVCFNPNEERLFKNITAIVDQVDKLVIIENGSQNSQGIINSIRKYNSKIAIIENNENIGIAGALNQILEYGIRQKYEWAITLDQDSIAPVNIVMEFEKYMKYRPGIIFPKIVDINTKEKFDKVEMEAITDPESVITSGSCINLDMANALHGFDERLFIDFVDTDLQMRALLSGYHLIRVNNIRLMHEIGHLEEKRILFAKVLCSNHSSNRRYYQVRNRLYYRRKYFGKLAYLRELSRLFLGTLKVVIFEDDKKQKIIAFIKGIKDYKALLISKYESRI